MGPRTESAGVREAAKLFSRDKGAESEPCACITGQESNSDSTTPTRRVSSENGQAFGSSTAGFWRIALDSWSSRLSYPRMMCGPVGGRWSFGSGRKWYLSRVASGALRTRRPWGVMSTEREFSDDVIDNFEPVSVGCMFQDFGLLSRGSAQSR